MSFIDTKTKEAVKVSGNVSSIMELKLDLSSPLRYQRIDPLFQFGIDATIEDVTYKLIGPEGREKKDVKFMLTNGKPTENTMKFRDVLANLDEPREIIDLKYAVEPIKEVRPMDCLDINFRPHSSRYEDLRSQ